MRAHTLAPTFGWRAVLPVRLLAAPTVFVAALLSLGFGALYWIVGPDGGWGDQHSALAGALLDGRLSFADRPWLELVPVPGSTEVYSPLPPVPALTLLPAVAVWGVEIGQSLPAAIVGGFNVALVYLLVRRLGATQVAPWITVAFGTATHLWIAGNGGPHHYAQLVGVAFTLLALLAALAGRWPIMAGLAIGLAAGARLPMGLTLPLVLFLYGRRPGRDHLLVLTGLAVPALLVAWYNVARFGSPLDFGYARIPSDYGLVTDEPWYSDGLLSLSYIPRSLAAMLLAGPEIGWRWPWVHFSTSGSSIILTAPFLLLALRARGASVPLLWATVILVMLPSWAHGNWGAAQHGYRFILDATPLLVVLIAVAYRRRRADGWLIGTTAVGAAVTLFGFWPAAFA